MQHSSVKPVSLNTLLKREKAGSLPDSGKASDSFRPITMRTGALDDRKGSAYVEFGSTKVVCSVDGPKEPTKNVDLEPTEGQVRVFFKDTSVSGTVLSSSGSNFSSNSKENSGIRNALESALRSMIRLELFCKAQIDVEITVLEDDCGVLAASLIASSLALIHSGIQVYDVCVAAHIVMLADGRILVDPSASYSSLANSPELSQKSHLSVTVGLLPSLNQLACCEFIGIASPKQLRHAISVAIENALKLYPLLRETINCR